MKLFSKISLIGVFLVFLNGCDAQTLQALDDFNKALSGNSGSYSSSYSNQPKGFLTGETISGFNKICFYNRVGSTYTINIPSTSLCPLTN
tara:strand:+ start:612 stop:881 length:270 start_codon:yes stop_codon:yes gene_type:complete